MATYMYTSTTGSNWDDDDEDFGTDVYKAAAKFAEASTLNNLALQQPLPAVEEEVEPEPEQSAPLVALPAPTNYNCEPHHWPLYAHKIIKLWDSTARPAYLELSHDGTYCYPDQRVNYKENWTAAKLCMGANINWPMMMSPSPLRLSKTWVRDSHGEFVEERGVLVPSMPALVVESDGDSGEERDEVCTPPGSPLRVQWQDDAEEYDPITGAIDLPSHAVDAMKIDLARDFVDFSSIAGSFDVADVLGIKASNIADFHVGGTTPGYVIEPALLAACVEYFRRGSPDLLVSRTPPEPPVRKITFDEHIFERFDLKSSAIIESCVTNSLEIHALPRNSLGMVDAAQVSGFDCNSNLVVECTEQRSVTPSWKVQSSYTNCLLECSKKVQTTTELAITTFEANQTTLPLPQSHTNHRPAECDESHARIADVVAALGGSAQISKTTMRSPDLKFLYDPANASLFQNTVAAGWFAFSSVPWGRIAIAAVGAVVDVVAFVARC